MSGNDVFGAEYYRDQLYTPAQSRILTIIPRITGTISMLGSSLIVYIILKDRKKKLRRLYHRVLLSFSCLDILCSFNWALSSWVVPKGTPGVWGAKGTWATCEASGFVSQFATSLAWYSAFLCTYYALIIAFRVRENTIAKWMEPIFHFCAYAFPIGFGGYMIATDNYNPNNVSVGWCFINVYPMDCLRRDEVPCERGASYGLWMIITFGLTIPALFLVLVSCVTTYCGVRCQYERSSRWNFGQGSGEAQRETAIQAFLYIATVFATWFPTYMSTLLSPSPNTEENRYFHFPVTVFVKIFLPLQGFWNFVIYIRPRYRHIRKRHPRMSNRGVLAEILGNKRVKPKPAVVVPANERNSCTIGPMDEPGLDSNLELVSPSAPPRLLGDSFSNFFDDFMPESRFGNSVIGSFRRASGTFRQEDVTNESPGSTLDPPNATESGVMAPIDDDSSSEILVGMDLVYPPESYSESLEAKVPCDGQDGVGTATIDQTNTSKPMLDAENTFDETMREADMMMYRSSQSFEEIVFYRESEEDQD